MTIAKLLELAATQPAVHVQGFAEAFQNHAFAPVHIPASLGLFVNALTLEGKNRLTYKTLLEETNRVEQSMYGREGNLILLFLLDDIPFMILDSFGHWLAGGKAYILDKDKHVECREWLLSLPMTEDVPVMATDDHITELFKDHPLDGVFPYINQRSYL